MSYKLLVQNSKTSEVFDATTLAGSITHQTYIRGQPGKLTVTFQQDPKNTLKLVNGSIITFTKDGKGIFYGYIFKMGTDATGVYKITAYDQLRYWTNAETYLFDGTTTASEDFQKICGDVYPALGGGGNKVVVAPSYIVPRYLYDTKKLSEIVQDRIDKTNVAESKLYFLKDDFGTLKFTEVGAELTDLVIGEKSLLTSYQYEISIDSDTYNAIKIYRDNEETGKRDVWLAVDSGNQRQWGKLQYTEKAPDDYNEAQVKELAESYLSLKNRETKTMKLTALGAVGLVAGSGFRFKLEKLSIQENMWITAATHTYRKDYHTMELEVFSPMFAL